MTGKAEKKQAVKFTKEKLCRSQKFADNRDILNALLEDNKEYTTDEAQETVNLFLKGGVR
ncbi:MAG: hypothetical protein VB119_04280 [Candidatus Metalachnospira sp.]|nr:hypothetical protein [Candidatus Metalachnospira sp.]